MRKDEMLKDNEFGRLLESLQVRRGWRQEDAAAHLGFSTRTYSDWITGKKLPFPEQLKHIAATFKLEQADEDELYRAAAQMSPEVDNLPSLQNPFFTGRTTQLEDLRQRLQEHSTDSSPRIICISGLTGMGKTQLALEYAHSYYLKVYRAVFWVNAANRTTATISYDAILNKLGLPELNEREAESRIQAVKEWLARHKGWLLIMDNADDLRLARSFLPSKPMGHVLLTTCSDIVGTSNIAEKITVEEMKQEEGIRFLLRRIGKLRKGAELDTVAQSIREAAGQLVELLGGHPLALDQAGAYIDGTDDSFDEYIQLYEKERKYYLDRRGLSEDSDEPPGPVEHPASVVATVMLSFRKAWERQPLASDLLYFCSFLQPDSIPEELLSQDEGMKLDVTLFKETVVALRWYSLIKRNTKEKSLSMHRLVQAVLSDNLDIVARIEWRKHVLYSLNAAFPEVDFKNWKQCSRLVPHVSLCATWYEGEVAQVYDMWELLYKAGVYLREQGQYAEAEKLFARGIATYELKVDNLTLAKTLNALASTYLYHGEYEKAEPLYQRVLLIRKQVLGAAHPDTAAVLNNLAILYQQQGKYELVEPLYQQALDIRERCLGERHPDTAASLNNLANFYQVQGKYKKAEALYLRAIDISERELGIEHPDTAMNLSNLAALYRIQGKYEKAEPLYLRAIDIRERQLGTDHPDTAMSMNNLAILYKDQGRYDEAEPLYEKALSIRKLRLGEEHPDTARNLQGLAELYCKQGRYQKAQPLYEQALEIRELKLGIDHPETARSLHGLANLFAAQDKYKDAEALYQHALTIQEQRLGASHPHAQETRKDYVSFLRGIGSEAKAIALEAYGEQPI